MSPEFGARRVVSLVPSLTETLWDLHAGERLVGVTRFRVRPEQARDRAAVVGGTKDPDVEAILALRPDLVLADEDENKPEHLDAFGAAGIDVYVTRLETVVDAARETVEVGRRVGRSVEAEGWRQRIQERVAEMKDATRLVGRLRAFVPIWRRPVMTMGGRTYMSDLVHCAGFENVFAEADRKYFETTAQEVRALSPDVVLLPTEPYRFKDVHRAEFADLAGVDPVGVDVVDGQAMTWFGTHTLRGLDLVAEAAARIRGRLQNA